MSTDTGQAGGQPADARKQALGATRAAEIAIAEGEHQTAIDALHKALGQVRKQRDEQDIDE